jgi:hypothetical protein
MTLSKIDRPIQTAFLATATMLTSASCVAEWPEDCPPDTRLFIRTDQEMGFFTSRGESRAHNIDEWYDCIDTMEVYVFDENEKYVTVWRGGRYTPGEEFEVPLVDLTLNEGVYTFVAWTNLGDEYLCNLEELTESGDDFHLDDMRMSLIVPGEGDAIESDLNHRHHGILERAYVSNNSILFPGPNVIVLHPSLHRVNVTVTGLESATATDPHTVTVIDNNSSHDFRNACIPNLDRYHHRRALTPVQAPSPGTRADVTGALGSSVYLLQLHDATDTTLEIHRAADPGTALFSEPDLVSLIRTVYGFNGRSVNLDEILEFDINIDLSSKSVITIVVNSWVYVINKGIL